MSGVVFSGEEGMKHCRECDSPELFDGEINQYGLCFGCSGGDGHFGKPEPARGDHGPREPLQPDPRSPYWLRSGRHG